jgi:hypothetical protein
MDLDLISKLFTSSFLATLVSIVCCLFVFLILLAVVNCFRLNYGRDAYWVFSWCFFVLILSWFFSFGFFMSLKKETKSETKVKFHSILFTSTEVKGNSIFTHMGGRQELFDVERVELMCIGGDLDNPKSTWQLNACVSDIWFVSYSLKGRVDVCLNAGQLINYNDCPPLECVYWQERKDLSSSDKAENYFWQEFHSADIAFKNKKPVSVLYRHMRFKDGEWITVASYSAKFSDTPLLDKYDGYPPQPLEQSDE